MPCVDDAGPCGDHSKSMPLLASSFYGMGKFES